MIDNKINIVRFSQGYWSDLVFTIQFAGEFLLSFWTALVAIAFVNIMLNKNRDRLNLLFTTTAISVLICGHRQLLRLDYNLESVGYMAAAASGVGFFLLALYFLLPARHKIWQYLTLAMLCGLLSAIFTLELHQEIEKFTYFSEKMYANLSISKIDLSIHSLNFRLALFSFGLYIGLAEEFCKFFFLLIPFYKVIRKGNLVEIFMITIFVSAGFAIYENIIYAYNYGVNISLIRNVFNGHIFFGMISALLLAKVNKLAKEKELNFAILVIPVYLLISLLHGTWDFIAVNFSSQQVISYTILGSAYIATIIYSSTKLYSIIRTVK